MAVDLIGSVSQAGSAPAQATLGQDDLFKILLTQLTYQDPLKPLDNQEFIAQLAQFSGLEQSRQMNEKFDAVLSQQSGNQAIGLLGRTVEIGTQAGGVIGQVTTVNLAGTPSLTVKTSDGQFLDGVRLSQVLLVR